MMKGFARKSTSEWKCPEVITELYKEKYSSNPKELKPSGNAPVAGARIEKAVPVGEERFQFYSLATPNGQKVGILLEELGLGYDAHVINIIKGDQFTSGFVDINPNSKIPALFDREKDLKLMESGAILMYLAETYDKFLPVEPVARMSTIQWLMFQMGSVGPMFGQMSHFVNFAPKTEVHARNYGAERYGMETQRLLSVIENRLNETEYLGCDEYTIADMATYPWVKYAAEKFDKFLQVDQYPRTKAWVEKIASRPAVQRGETVCNFQGVAKPWLEQAKN